MTVVKNSVMMSVNCALVVSALSDVVLTFTFFQGIAINEFDRFTASTGWM